MTQRASFIRLLLMLLSLFAASSFAAPAHGSAGWPVETIDAAHLDAVLPVRGSWRFSQADDPRFADPGFDDSGWPLLRPDEALAAAHLPAATDGYNWARIHLRILNANGPLAMAISTRSARQFTVLANGVPLFSTAAMGEHLRQNNPPAAVALPQGQDVVVAVRFLAVPFTAFPTTPNFPVREFRVGHVAELNELLREQRIGVFDRDFLSTLVVSVLFLAFVPIGFTLFLAQRSHAEYLWLGFGSLFLTGYFSFDVGLRFGVIPYSMLNMLVWHYFAWLALLADLAFCATISTRRRPRWIYFFYGFMVVIPLFGVYSETLLAFSLVGTMLVLLVVVPSLLLHGFRKGNIECAVLLPFFAFFIFASVFQQISIFFPRVQYPPRTVVGYLGFDLTDLGILFMAIGLLIVVLYRFIRVSRDEQQAAAEFEAARSVQQVLIPESGHLPTVPGYRIDSVYQPARLVGGDFFQIIPLQGPEEDAAGDSPQGKDSPAISALVILGDVSGKGMPAAMTVAVLVGAIRSFAESTNSPAEVLAGLNRRIHNRGVGFTTCIVLRLDATHTVTAASAGHLEPYLQGKELSLNSGLPLGLTPEAEYAEFTFALAPGEQLTLVTDGVVESTAHPSKELFGFSRTEAISRESAQIIAETACRFAAGCPQADDITVLTITRVV